jgi:hypothetical protein
MVIRSWVGSCWRIEMRSFFQSSTILNIGFWDAEGFRLTFSDLTIYLILPRCWISICFPFIRWTHGHILFQICTKRSLMVIRSWVGSCWRVKMGSFFQSSFKLNIGFWDAKGLRLTFSDLTIYLVLARSWVGICFPFIWWTQGHILF